MIATFKINAARYNKTMEQRTLKFQCDSLEHMEQIHQRLTQEIATKGLINADQTDGTKFTRIIPAAQFQWITIEAPVVLEADNSDVPEPKLTLN